MFIKFYQFDSIFYIKIVKYIFKRYLMDINLENPLGSGGKLAKQYALLIQNLWINSATEFSP